MRVVKLPALKRPARNDIPRKAVYRLSVYLRCLHRLRDNGIPTVSSEALARAGGVKSTQLRKDLTYFGQFGTRGLGYDVDQLSRMITDTLGLMLRVVVHPANVQDRDGAALVLDKRTRRRFPSRSISTASVRFMI